ncbi:MAG TPA: penicillin-binding transpeptidase domain-containing protein [Deltaproteobacteria bacterium]|nr:penicillin-binding transpeptidase domain-containing protein [Deltaproteobacteria bacterium]HPJ95011.1 penicillin-binding transpeptidase domain-containing protein [Deltaproteobacteria bacterium]HPR51747.1 penicillin-binding transpeptidase domain-containing protein [Deltaproteobacteria bacterium]
MRRKRALRLRYVIIPIVAVAVFMFFFAGKSGEAESVVLEKASVVSKKSLSVLTPELIEEKGMTIDWDLQEYIANTVRRNKVSFASVVVMNARTGDILALYGKGEEGEDNTLCLDTYLAASLFKVVTAAAAIDSGTMSSKSKCAYNGNAHTLYKHQLTPKKNRWTREVTLERAFALSNNVVFAKIGAMDLGETPLLLTAMRMGFWKPPIEGIECSPSTLFIPQTQYNIAELASGFNRHTRISPVHAAQMITAVVNDGIMVRPRIVSSNATYSEQVIRDETARELRYMMNQTIKRGTVSRTFWNCRYDRILKDVQLGAKSGTIDGTDPEGRRNWFVGYAEHQKSGEAITIACLIIREDYYWIESDDLSKKIIRYYFSKPVTVAENN